MDAAARVVRGPLSVLSAMAIKSMDVTALDRMETETPAGASHFGWLCLGYALLILYSSTAVGPTGFNFVPQDPAAVWHRFLATRFLATGSDQRPDWMGNLLMLVPFGFLVAGAMWPARRMLKLPAVIGALLICAAVILGIKYLQLFFPPRTVTLNYIVAQSVGAAIGCASFAVWRDRIGRSFSQHDPVAMLVLGLWLYLGVLLVFLLMPLDVALNAHDLHMQWDRLPDALMAVPGAGRPRLIRLTLIVAATAAFIPVGALLTFVRDGLFRVRRSVLAATLMGLLLTSGLFALTTLVMSAAPSMVSILYRTAGIAIGAASIRWVLRRDPVRLRARIRSAVPWLVVPYLVVLIAVNRLWSFHWLSPHDVISQISPRSLMPLFDYYIVTKAEAAKNIVGHMVMYLPIGVGMWFRYGGKADGRAALLAAGVSAAVEAGRYLRPGLEGDINAVAVAGGSALLAMWVMPAVWTMLVCLTRQPASAPVRAWDRRAVSGVPGEVERL